MLIMAAENYTGPASRTTGHRAARSTSTYYTDALDANGVALRRLRRRRARHDARRTPLGVLSHYDAVIWYTGDDYVTRRPGQPGGTGTARLAVEEHDRRPRLPQRGRQAVLHRQERRASSTPRATSSATSGSRSRREGGEWCSADAKPEFDADDPRPPTAASRTTTTSSSTTWGPTSTSARGNTSTDEDGHPLPIMARARPVRGLSVEVRRAPGAGNQDTLGDVRGHELDPRSGALPAVRRLAQRRRAGCARARRRSTRSAARKYMAAGRGRRRPTSGCSKTLDLTGRPDRRR